MLLLEGVRDIFIGIRKNLVMNTTFGMTQPNPLKAYTQNRILYVSGLIVGETWRVYDILEKLVYQGVAADETANVALPVSGVYIIRSGSRTGKVVAR